MEKIKILIIEDDTDLSELIKDYLSIDGFVGEVADNGRKGIEMARTNKYSLIILDIMLPEVDGIGVCREIRKDSHIPILMLSAKSGEMDKILSLGVGADDYMTKPFSPMELIARIKAHLRRQTYGNDKGNKDDLKRYGELQIYKDSYKVLLNEKEIALTRREFQILDFLTDNEKIVFTKEQLHEGVWGYSEFMDENTIAVYIKRLREKIGDIGKKSIKTVWGVGYKWEYSDEK